MQWQKCIVMVLVIFVRFLSLGKPITHNECAQRTHKNDDRHDEALLVPPNIGSVESHTLAAVVTFE